MFRINYHKGKLVLTTPNKEWGKLATPQAHFSTISFDGYITVKNTHGRTDK
jgi:hypothetical protein